MRLKTSNPLMTRKILTPFDNLNLTEGEESLLVRINESEEGKQRVKGQILRLLLAENIDLYEFSKVEPTMEEVFFKLVSGQGGDPA